MQKIEKRKVCRYYARGKCVKEDCPFVHQAEMKKPCKFWIETGFCRKGKNCQFYHATKQQQKKDKKFMQKNKQHAEQKIQRNYVTQKSQSQFELKKQKLSQLKKSSDQQQTLQQNKKQQTQQKIDTEQLIRINQQVLQQLQSKTNYEQLQFFKLYPKSFPDQSKTLEAKQHIKKVELQYFTQKPFLQLLKQIQTKQEQEYYQIIRRYQDSFRLEDENQSKLYLINLRPMLYNKEMNMHFVFEENYVMLKIDQKQYPERRAQFEILNESIPLGYKEKLKQILDSFHKKNSVFQTLKYFQNNFEKLYESAKFKLQNQHFKLVELKQRIQQDKEKLRQQQQQQQQQKKEDDEEDDTQLRQQIQEQERHLKRQHHRHENHNNKIQNHNSNKKNHQVNHNHDKEQQIKEERKQEHDNHSQKKKVNPNEVQDRVTKEDKPNKKNEILFNKQQVNNAQKVQEKPKKQFRDYYQMDFNEHQKPEHQNLNQQITVESLVMQNCPYVLVEKLLLYIQCNCSKVLMYLFDAQQKKQLKLWVKLKCKKCNDSIKIVWERQVIHNKGQLISRMSFANGKLIDIGGIGWKVGCNCDEEIIKPKLFLPSERLQLNCHSCFSNMNITYNGIKHFNPFVKQFQMQEDKQLPLKGACNHDKYNFRWIRYACCGRPFACDQCHDINSIKQHEVVNGLTMVCGYCGYEQHVGQNCTKCKKQLIRGQDKAGHWQGGMGCRDQQLLSRKDAKKYAGMGKVESGKQQKKKQKQK